MNFTKLELELLFECVYQSALNDSLSTFQRENNLDDDVLDELTIKLRKVIDSELSKRLSKREFKLG